MALTIHNNMAAISSARLLGGHYSGLSTSARRLSSGLRVERAADDAAGLAIRELMRADTAALNQGIRNANDAISMIQTADGALQIIDEKLIRMKELAEQAATGTYNSDQRLMIDSEFQAMKSEIDRIANATDFNNVKMLCLDTANKLYIGDDDGSGGGTATPGEATAIFGSVTVLREEAITEDARLLYMRQNGEFLSHDNPKLEGWGIFGGIANRTTEDTLELSYTASTGTWALSQDTINRFAAAGVTIGISHAFSDSSSVSLIVGANTIQGLAFASGDAFNLTEDTHFTIKCVDYSNDNYVFTSGTTEYPNARVTTNWGVWYVDLDGDGNADLEADSGPYGFGIDLKAKDAGTGGGTGTRLASDYVTKIHFGTGNDSAEDYYYIESRDCTAKGLGIDGTDIQTQAKAQNALGTLNEAIIIKDSARAYFGAMQNRLENTVSNLQIQAENTQAAESRISDVDVALEMTEFVRIQVLTQTAVAMLAQTNSLPRMALQLMGG